MKINFLKQMAPGDPRPGQGAMMGYFLDRNDQFYMGLAYYLPGSGIDNCIPDRNLSYYVVEGELTLEYNGDTYVLGPNDSFTAAPGDKHNLINKGPLPLRTVVIIGGPGAGPK